MSESMTAEVPQQARPIDAKERILTLDVLRGFALFGIMFVNVYAFVHPADWFTVNWSELGSAEYGAEMFKIAFTQGKFYSLFAILFGLGFTVQLASAERRGTAFAGRFFWRLCILYIIAFFHFLFLWGGDILNSYAASGMILLVAYLLKRLLDKGVAKVKKDESKKAPRWLMLAVAAFFMFGPLVGWGLSVGQNASIVERHQAGEQLTEQEQKFIERREKRMDPEARAKREERQQKIVDTFTNGSYLDTVKYRWDILMGRFFGMIPFWFSVFGLFLIGAYFGRNNFIGRAAELKSGFIKLGIGCFVIGALANVGFLYAHIFKPENGGQFWMWLTFANKTLAGVTWALMYVSIITLAMLGSAKKYLKVFAPVGQMALTNYLLQSLVGGLVFYGYGLGLVGKLNAFEQFAYMVVVFSCQVVFSRWWLSRYRFGPAEWLWRSMTYLSLQPMRLDQDKDEASPKLA